MIFNMSGGGAGLNFKVVGGTATPTNPAENTIWVNTSTEITGYIFSNKNPSLLDVADWAANVGMYNGTKTVANGSITITSNNGSFCYTLNNEGFSEIPCTAGKTYLIQWDYSGYDSNVQVFPHYDTTNGTWAYSSACKLEYTVPDGVEYFSFIFGTGGTTTYSNIRITEKDYAFGHNDIWIYTGASSSAEFNALKKNNIMVCPVSAKQYVNGSWVAKTAKIYKNGAWVDWAKWLYNNGVWGNGTALTKGYTYGSPTVTYNENFIRVICGSNNISQYFYFPQMENLDGRSKIVFKFKSNAAYTTSYSEDWGAGVRIGVATSTDHNNLAAQAKQYNLSSGTEYTLEVDVSNLTGYYYIHLMFARGDSKTSGSVNADILEVYLA